LIKIYRSKKSNDSGSRTVKIGQNTQKCSIKKVFKTNSVTLTKNHGFREQKMGLYRELSGGLSGRPAGIPSA
jgi:hypothetical protein